MRHDDPETGGVDVLSQSDPFCHPDRGGLRDAMDAGVITRLPVAPLAHLFDRAALATPDEAADYGKAIKALIQGLEI